MNDHVRFWSKVDKSGDCWVWTAYVQDSGYGWFRLQGRSVRAHRVSYELANGPIPEGLYVLHSCDNKLCVKPEHLRVGTHAENVREAVERGLNHNASKTHCVHGHEYTPGNTYRWRGSNKRGCRTCRIERSREWHELKAA